MTTTTNQMKWERDGLDRWTNGRFTIEYIRSRYNRWLLRIDGRGHEVYCTPNSAKRAARKYEEQEREILRRKLGGLTPEEECYFYCEAADAYARRCEREGLIYQQPSASLSVVSRAAVTLANVNGVIDRYLIVGDTMRRIVLPDDNVKGVK